MKLKLFAVLVLALTLVGCSQLTYVQQQAFDSTISITREDGAFCSGVVISHDKTTYRMLTAAHCIVENLSDIPGEPVFVPVGTEWKVRVTPSSPVIGSAKVIFLGDLASGNDFAELEFTSKSKLGVAQISDTPLQDNEQIFNVSMPLGLAKIILGGRVLATHIGPDLPGGILAIVPGATFGSSGSAIFNERGYICGILVAKVNGESLMFIVPIEKISLGLISQR